MTPLIGMPQGAEWLIGLLIARGPAGGLTVEVARR